jgi:hypothetical protein
MATAREYAQWIVDNQDLAGTENFQIVASAYERAKQRERAPTAPEEEGSLLGIIPEAIKGTASGVAGLIESGLYGASFLLPEEQEQAARRAITRGGEAVQEFLAPAAGYEDSVTRKFTGALGSTLPFLATAPLSLPVAIGAGLAMGTAAGAGEAAQRAEAAGATEEEISRAAGLGIIPGASEMLVPLGIGRSVGRLRKALGEDTVDAITAQLQRAGAVGRVTGAGAAEGIQEAATEIAQNLIAQEVYDPETDLLTGTGESLGYGAGVGGFIQAIAELAIRRDKSRYAATEAEREQEAEAAAQEAEARRGEQLDLFEGEPAPEPTAGTDLFGAPVVDRAVEIAPEEEVAAPPEAETQLDLFDQTPVPEQLDLVTRAEEEAVQAIRDEEFDRAYAARQGAEQAKIQDDYTKALAQVQEEQLQEAETEQERQGILDKVNAEAVATPTAMQSAFLKAQKDAVIPLNKGLSDLTTKELALVEEIRAAQPAVAIPLRSVELDALGVKPNAAVRKRISGRDLGDTAQREQVREELITYANRYAPDTQTKERILRFTESEVFTEPVEQAVPEQITLEEQVSRRRAEEAQVTAEVSQLTREAVEAGLAEEQAQVEQQAAEEQSRTRRDAAQASLLRDITPLDTENLVLEDAESIAKLDTLSEAPTSASKAPQVFRKYLREANNDLNAALTNIAFDANYYGNKSRSGKGKDSLVEGGKKTFKDANKAADWVKQNLSPDIVSTLGQHERFVQGQNTGWQNVDNTREAQARTAEAEAEQIAEQVAAQERETTATQEGLLDEYGSTDFTDTNAQDIIDELGLGDTSVVDYLRADAVAATMPKLSAEGNAALQNNDVSGALDNIASRTPNNQVKRTARALVNAIKGKGVKVTFRSGLTDSKGKVAAGQYNPTTNEITINPDMGDVSTHTVLHEASHAATQEVIKNPSHPITKQLNRLYQEAKKAIPEAYGSESLSEFVAEVYTNPEYRTQLAAFKRAPTNKTIWERFVNAIRRLLGMQTDADVSLADDALQYVEAILSPDLNTRGAAYMAQKIADAQGNKAFTYVMNTGKGFASNPLLEKAKDNVVARWFSWPRATRNTVLLGTDMQTLVDFAVKSGNADFAQAAKDLRQRVLEAEGYRNEGTKIHRSILKSANEAFKGDTAALEVFRKLAHEGTISEVDVAKAYSKTGIDKSLLDANGVPKAYSQYGYRYVDGQGNVIEKYFTTRDARETARDAVDRSKLPKGVRIERTEPDADKVAKFNEFKPLWESLTPAQKSAYIGMRDAYKDIHRDILTALDYNLQQLEIDEETKNLVRENLFRKALSGGVIDPYFPLERMGDYWLQYSYTDETGQLDTAFSAFESDTQRNKFILELERDTTVKDKESIRRMTKPEAIDAASAGNIPIGIIKELNAAISSLPKTEMSDAQKAKIAATQDLVKDLLFKQLPEQALLAGFKKRKGYPGFEPNPLRAFESRYQTMTNSYARIQSKPAMDGAVQRLRELGAKMEVGSFEYDIYAALAGTKGQTDQLGMVNMPSYAEFSRNPALSKTTRNLRAGVFLWTLGFAPAAVAVNTTVLPLVVGPLLNGKYGAIQSTKALAKAHKMYAKTWGKYNRKAYVQFDAAGNPVADSDLVAEHGGWSIHNVDYDKADLSQEEKVMKYLHDELINRGADNRTLMSDMVELDSASSGWMQKMVSMGGALFNHGERYTRQVAALADLNLNLRQKVAKERGTTLNKVTLESITDAELQKFGAQSAIEASDFADYANSSALLTTGPRIAQGDIGALFWQYKHFPVKLFGTQMRMYKALFNNLFRRGSMSPEQTLEAKQLTKSLMWMYGAGGALLGAKGIPIYGALAAVANMFLGEDEDDFNTIVAKEAGQGWYYGGLATLFGIDITDRASITNLLVRDRGNYRPDDEMMYLLESYAGPTFGIGKRIIESGLELFDGNPRNDGRAVENMLPTGLSNSLKTLRLYQDGYETRRGDPIVGDVAAGDLVLQIAGFRPMAFRAEDDKRSRNYRVTRGIQARRGRLLDRYYYAYKEGDNNEVQDIIKEIQEFNRDHPNAGIAPDTIRSSLRQRTRNSIISDITGGTIVDRRYISEILQSNAEFED